MTRTVTAPPRLTDAQRVQIAREWCERVYARGYKPFTGTDAEMRAYYAGHRNGCVQTAFDILLTLGVVPGGEDGR